jgi:hypothetical protein
MGGRGGRVKGGGGRDRLPIGSYETSPIIWGGKPAQSIQCLEYREITGRTQTLPWWLGGRRGKDDIKKIHCMAPLEKLIAKLPIYLKIRLDSWTVSSGRKPIKAYWTSGRLHIV